MQLLDSAKEIRGSIETTYIQAYTALQTANITMGIIDNIADAMPYEDGIKVSYRSVMGCELPTITLENKPIKLDYGFINTDSNVDKAVICFDKVKHMTAVLAEVKTVFTVLPTLSRKRRPEQMLCRILLFQDMKPLLNLYQTVWRKKKEKNFSRMKVIKAQKKKYYKFK
jgi:V/A-type H+-transporting ATPase subunit D